MQEEKKEQRERGEKRKVIAIVIVEWRIYREREREKERQMDNRLTVSRAKIVWEMSHEGLPMKGQLEDALC